MSRMDAGDSEAELRREYEAELRGALGLRDATIKAAYSQWFAALRDIDERYEPYSRHWATRPQASRNVYDRAVYDGRKEQRA